MNLQTQIQTDLVAAMRAKDTEKLAVLRMLKTAINNAAIERKTTDLEDTEVISIIRKNVKTRTESAEAFTKGNRQELADKENREIAILEAYLPKAMPAEELEALVQKVITETGATSRKDMGTVMKTLNTQLAGRADGKTLSGLVTKLLPQN